MHCIQSLRITAGYCTSRTGWHASVKKLLEARHAHAKESAAHITSTDVCEESIDRQRAEQFRSIVEAHKPM
jgi:hypothetical protein